MPFAPYKEIQSTGQLTQPELVREVNDRFRRLYRDVAAEFLDHREAINRLANFVSVRQFVFTYRNNRENEIVIPTVDYTIFAVSYASLDADAYDATLRIGGVDVTTEPASPISVPDTGDSASANCIANNEGLAGQPVSILTENSGNNNDATVTFSIFPTQLFGTGSSALSPLGFLGLTSDLIDHVWGN